MSVLAFEQLQVLVTGVDAAIAFDVARVIASQGAGIVATDPDADRLARLQRDLRRHGVSIETAWVDLANPDAVRLWTGSLSAHGRLPQLMICCCAAGAGRSSRGKGRRSSAQLPDVALSECEINRCPARLAERILQPTLFRHAQPLRHAMFDNALTVVRHPTLSGVVNSIGRLPQTGSTTISTRRHLDGEAMWGGRLRLVPPSDRPSGRADAA